MFWLLPLTITGNGEYISRKELTHLGFTDLRFTHISLLSSTAICRQRLPCFLWSVQSFSQSISKRLVSVALMSGCVPLSKRKLYSAISFTISNSHGLQNASVTFSCSSLCICISRRSVLSLKACFSLRARSIGSGSSGFVISRSAWDLLVTPNFTRYRRRPAIRRSRMALCCVWAFRRSMPSYLCQNPPGTAFSSSWRSLSSWSLSSSSSGLSLSASLPSSSSVS